jgi:hypothetical protein
MIAINIFYPYNTIKQEGVYLACQQELLFNNAWFIEESNYANSIVK